MRRRTLIFARVLVMAPLGARAADLIVWWDKGFYAQEDEAIAEVVAAFEQNTGKQAELAHFPEEEPPNKIGAALDAGRPPDIAYGLIPENIGQWALDDRLVDLTDVIGSFANMFDADALDSVALVNGRTGQRAAYGCLWAARATTSTSGRVSWSRRGSRSPTSPKIGMGSGPSGAMRCSQRFAK